MRFVVAPCADRVVRASSIFTLGNILAPESWFALPASRTPSRVSRVTDLAPIPIKPHSSDPLLAVALHLIESDVIVPEESPDDIHMDAVPDMEECVIADMLRLTLPQDLLVHIEVEVKMSGCRLHAPDTPFAVESWATTLATKPGGTELEAVPLSFHAQEPSRDHAFDREAWGVRVASVRPRDGLGDRIEREVGEFRKGEA